MTIEQQITASKYIISAETIKLWQDASFTIKQSQKKFLRAYESTLNDALGEGWKDRWKTDPRFASTLYEVEDFMRDTCRSQDMSLTTFNRYRMAARKATLLGVPMQFGNAFKLDEIKEATEISKVKKVPLKEAFTIIRKDRIANAARQIVSVDATVLPKPTLDEISKKLIAHMREVKASYGPEAAARLCQQLEIVVHGRLPTELATGSDPAP